MLCIFCRNDASASISVEHIIPESLGNTEHVLATGIVCDGCNNYFSRKIEGPLLASPYMKHARSRMWVPNKRGFIPPLLGFMPSVSSAVDVWINGPQIRFGSPNAKTMTLIEQSIQNGRTTRVCLPIETTVDKRLMSRFLGKVAIEALAQRLMPTSGWREEILSLDAIEPLRQYVRRGDSPQAWDFSQRRIYFEDNIFVNGLQHFEILNEFDFVYTEERILLFVLAIFGDEFVIDMGRPSIDSYRKWLSQNHHQSPLAPW